MKRILVILSLLLLAGGIEAQELTLDSCRAMALRNQTALSNARLELESAQEVRKAAFTKYFPTLSMAAGAFHSKNYLIDASTEESGAKIDVEASFDGHTVGDRIEDIQAELDRAGINVNLQRAIDNFVDRFSFDATLQMLDKGLFVNAMVTQPIFAGGRIVNGNRLAKLGVDVAELQLMMSENEVLLNVEQNYWQVVSLQLKKQPVDQAILMLDTLERDAQAAVEAGVIGRSDLLKVRLKRNEMLSSRTQLNNGIRLATMALCQYIGLPYTDSVRVASALSAEPSQAPQQGRDSVTRRTEYLLLEKAVEAERLRKKMLIGETLPQVAVGATYGANNLMGSAKHNGILFATVNIPITAWWEASHNIRKQRIASQIAENNRKNLSEQMALQQQLAYNNLSEAYTQIALKRQAVTDAEDNLSEVKNHYDAGLASVSEFLEAQTLLCQAQNQLADQLIDYKLKELRYRQLTP